MKGSYGRVQYGVQALGKGTETGSYVGLGLVDRPRVNIRSGTERIDAVGDWNARELSEGMALTELGLNIVALQSPTFLQNAERDGGGELPWLSFEIGYDKGADEYCITVIDCKIDSFTFRCDAGGRPTVDANLIGGKATKAGATCGPMPWLVNRSYRYFELQWDEVPELLAFELSVAHNLDSLGVIAGTATVRDPERIWDYLEEGQEVIGGTLTYLLGDTTLDVQDCLIPEENHELVLSSCGDVSPPQSLVVALYNVKKVEDAIEIPVGGNIAVTVPFMAEGWAFNPA